MSDPAESAEKPGFVEELRLAGEKIHPLRSRSSGSASVEPLRILVLEDMPGEAVVIVRELRRGGLHFRSRRVETEEDFRRELLDFAPDLILADFSLPQVTAFDAMRVLAETRSGVPFILVTSARSEEIAVECMKRGADDYILKDNLMRLPSAVRNAVAKSRANRERRRAEAALRRSERRYRLIAENTRDLILVIDRRGRILYASAASAALLGRLADQLVPSRGTRRPAWCCGNSRS